MAYLAHTGVFWAGLVLFLVTVCSAPTIVAIWRKAEHLGFIMLLNVVFPPAAMVVALKDAKRRSRGQLPVAPAFQPTDLVRPGPHF